MSQQETLYVNGVEVAHGGSNRSITPDIFIGRRNDGFYIDGLLDEVMIWDRALGSDEVLSLYDASADQYTHIFGDLTLGNHTFTGYVVDSLGNTVQTGRSVTLLDGTAPETLITPLLVDTTSPATAMFLLTSNETATFECSLDSAPFTVCTSPYTTS